MYYSHPFRLAKTSIAKQSTSHCVVFDTQADFVGAIEHIAPLGSCEFAKDYRKIGAFCRVDVGIDPYVLFGEVSSGASSACALRSRSATSWIS